MTPDLSRLLRPRSIAVIGGGAWAPAVIRQCRKMDYAGEIWAVNPTRAEMAGVPCVPSLDQLPAPPDAVFVGVNRHLTIETVATLSAMGAGGAVCFASGFAEAEDDRGAGADLQARLIAAAGEMPVLGPNCYGCINYLDGALLWPDEHGGTRVERGVAIIGQSSNMLINLTMQQRGLPLGYVLAAGNQASVGLADMAMAVLEDPRITAVGLHIEGVGDVRAFEAMAARARALGKPVVAIKVGRSEQAQAATISHTASLAGGDAASRAFLARLGIATVDTLPAFLETLKLLHVHGPLSGRRLASISCSGGEASLMADAAMRRRVELPALTQAQHDGVKATLSDLVTVANPLDYHTFIWGDTARMTETYCAMMACGFDLTCLVFDYPRADRSDPQGWQCGEDAFIAAAARTGVRAAMVASLPENMPEARSGRLMAAGIAPILGLDELFAATEASADIAEAWSRPAAAPLLVAPPNEGGRLTTLDEAAAKAALAEHGLQVPAARVASTPAEAAVQAGEIGFPVALKGLGVAHKTEAGAVRLGLLTPEEVMEAASAMTGTQGFLVERMAEGSVAELILGVVRDPVYGFTLTIGAGGILAELLQDSATLLIPASEQDVRAAISGLRIASLLAGYRGRPAADMDSMVSAAMAVQRFAAAECARLEELDINPLICTPEAAIAVDALIRLRD